MNDRDEVLGMLSNNPRGFFVRYPRTINITGRRWFFVPFKESRESDTISSTICEDLRAAGLIIPAIDDEEFQVQHALGVQSCRVYIRSGDERK